MYFKMTLKLIYFMSVNDVLFTFKSLNCQYVLYIIIVINTCMNDAPKKLVIHSAKQS